jgi:hypothetical protein
MKLLIFNASHDYEESVLDSNPRFHAASRRDALRWLLRHKKEDFYVFDPGRWEEHPIPYKDPIKLHTPQEPQELYDSASRTWRPVFSFGVFSMGDSPLQFRTPPGYKPPTDKETLEMWLRSFPGRAWWTAYHKPYPGYECLEVKP